MTAPSRRVYVAVAACAIVIYLGALWNRYALDDLNIVVFNPLVRSLSGIWRAFGGPYWPPEYGGKMYRPLVIASFAVDRFVGAAPWFHAINLLWHAAASLLVAALAERWAGLRAALIAGLLFAVHPVHVEAVANLVGRAELMAACFTVLAVYAAVERQSVGWSAAALALGLLSKENAAVAPGLIVWAWLLGLSRPSRRRIMAFAASWAAVGLVYGVVRWLAVHPYARGDVFAPVFIGATPLEVRLTAVAAFADVARLLVFPLTLRADYSPNEFTLVHSPLDGRFLLGAGTFLGWVALLWWTWRKGRGGGRTLEAFGIGWIAIAFLPVANLLFPTGVLIAERTLYLPSVGLALAVGAALRRRPEEGPGEGAVPEVRLPPRPRRPPLEYALGLVLVAAAARTAARVPVWRDQKSVTLSMFDDSPLSYGGPARSASLFQSAGQPGKALAGFQTAIQIYDRDPSLFVGAADAAFAVGRPGLANSLLGRANQLCFRCTGYLVLQAAGARARGDTAVADSLLDHARAWERQ
jgi:protein O-mannosyl-transferase